MIQPATHTTADGSLTFVIEDLGGGDYLIGFRGLHWHTHADILASMRGGTEADAVNAFVDDLLSDRSVIAVEYRDGALRDAWVSGDPAKEGLYREEGETIELRYWSGRPFTP